MAFNLNNKFKKEIEFIPSLYILFKINKIENYLRKIKKLIIWKFSYNEKKKKEVDYDPENLVNEENFLSYKQKLQKNNYIYVENFFEKKFYNKINNNWPKNYEFRTPFGLDKFYDTGFIYKKHNKINTDYQKYEWIKHLHQYFKSQKFINILKELTDNDLYFESSGFNQTRKGSYIALHLDDIEKDNSIYESINCNIIVDSSESKNCGNLALGSSNKWEDLYFKSPNIKNSVLIYKIGYNHYHGFKPVKKNEYRKAINARFLKKNY